MMQAAATQLRETPDRGTYALVLTVEETQRVEVGSLGTVRFPPGTYVYAGGTARGLEAALERLAEPDGSGQRHVDRVHALTAERTLHAFPGDPASCDLATHTARVPGALPVLGFGSTGCSCLTHLHGFLDAEPGDVEAALEAWTPEPAEAPKT